MLDRSSYYTIESKKPEYYSDFLTNFDKNPLTGYLARVTNEDAIKQALRNLILTRRTERFYDSSIGCKLLALTFEPMDLVTEQLMKKEITMSIQNHEPRVTLQDVKVIGDQDLNAYFIEVDFTINNIPAENFNLQVIVNRVR